MKSRNFLLGLASFAALVTAVPASAADGSRVELNVPFSFVVEGQTLPAGSYSVSEDGQVFYIRGSRGSLILSNGPVSYAPASQAKLVFRRENGVAYLKGIQISDESFEIPVHTETTAIQRH